MKVLDTNEIYSTLRRKFVIKDDFEEYVSGDRFTLVATDAGTATHQDAASGVLLLAPSDGTVADNDEIYLKTTKEVFKIADGKPIRAEARIKFTEANTDDANIAFGLADAVAANTIVDDGAGLDTSFSGAAFYKVDGENLWRVIYSDGATQTIVQLSAANIEKFTTNSAPVPGGGTWTTLTIELVPLTSTKVDVNFLINDVLYYKMKDKTYANATEANGFIAAKNGGANNEALYVDYLYFEQLR